jgi:hypothetical protein
MLTGANCPLVSEIHDQYQHDCDNEIQNNFQQKVDPACSLKIFGHAVDSLATNLTAPG